MAGVAEERGGHCALRRNDRGRRDGPHHCGLRVQYLQQRHLNRGGSRDINRRSYDRCPVLGCTTNVCAKGTASRCSTARLNGSRCERSADAREKRRLASLLGMTPENLSRSFTALASHGVMTEGRAIVIKDRKKCNAWRARIRWSRRSSLSSDGSASCCRCRPPSTALFFR